MIIGCPGRGRDPIFCCRHPAIGIAGICFLEFWEEYMPGRTFWIGGRTADNNSITSQGFLFRVNEWLIR
jgi:hypothetical protein